MEPELSRLAVRVAQATGSDKDLDRDLATAFARPIAEYTASVADCRALAAAVLPEWRLHLGFSATGMFPYACLANNGTRIISDAPTVPLAILRAIMDVMASLQAVR
jgi:hypothetical protein